MLNNFEVRDIREGIECDQNISKIFAADCIGAKSCVTGVGAQRDAVRRHYNPLHVLLNLKLRIIVRLAPRNELCKGMFTYKEGRGEAVGRQ